jgi:hypothetical protein
MFSNVNGKCELSIFYHEKKGKDNEQRNLEEKTHKKAHFTKGFKI